jgi:hypothetical protein
MNTRIKIWLQDHPKSNQWLWFVGLWLAGLVTVTVLTYPIKLLIKLAS